MAHHSKTLVVDFDDTLAITLNRDWVNAKANQSLINRLNDLYDDGWDIHIVTARGQLSCEGDCEAADRKYRQQIENWLSQHAVKYTSLSFQKKLAVYYIDDKGITPQEFLSKFNRVKLEGGLSGSEVYYDTAADAIFKTDKNTQYVIEWYNVAKLYCNIPQIYSVIGDTIKMEKLYSFDGCIGDVLNQLKKFKDVPPLYPGLLKHKYIDRCTYRIKDEIRNDVDISFLETVLEYAAEFTDLSFSHGDFSISNIMSDISGKGVYLIDPINDPTLLSSWQIDLAKLYMSIGFEYGDDDERRAAIRQYALDENLKLDFLHAHEIGHYCRVYPYATPEKKKFILNQIKTKLNVFRQKVNIPEA